MTVSLAMMTGNPDAKPRHMVFSKMEGLMSLMSDTRYGVPIRNKKNFMSTVPSLFTGNDLVTWLAEQRCDGDTVDALNLATFLCMYGYIYPVDPKTYTVKDDKSIFYRFQSPHYWPSKNIKLTNESYIIYLLKRSKRNKQKHALEEYEQVAFNKLQKVFSDKIVFLKNQAEEQVKMHGERQTRKSHVYLPVSQLPSLTNTGYRVRETVHTLEGKGGTYSFISNNMGGCVGGKSDQETVDEDLEGNTPKKSRRDSSKPWNRNSLQVYCGPENRKKVSPEEKKADNPNPDNPPGSEVKSNLTESQKDVSEETVQKEVQKKDDEIKAIECVTGSEQQQQHSAVSGLETSILETQSSDQPKISVPCIVRELSDVPESPGSLGSSPSQSKPWNVVKRPRSLETDNRRLHLSRPLSYSPGNLKTRHPRSLHSIYETPVSSKHERPKSIDLHSMFEAKGFDIHVQKLRRLQTQKSPQKSKNKLDFGLRPRSAESTDQPNQVKCLEEGPSRCFQPSQMANRRTKNKDLKLKEVQYLRQAIGRPRLKFSKCIECFLQRNEQYFEYDPFLNPTAAQPANPWITDDEAMWDINSNLVEVPTEIRIKKWGLSFEDLLADKTGLHEFDMFLKKEYSQENMRFYQACKELMVCPQSMVDSLKNDIECQYLTPGAPCEVNIDSKTMEKVSEMLKAEKAGNIRYIFQPAVEHIYTLMKKDSYTRFLRSEQYKALLLSAQTHYTKKRFFNFGSNKKKTPSPQPKRRGSATSDQTLGGENEIGGASYHSYSTGNLRELDDKPKKTLRQTNSPSVRRRTEQDRVENGKENRRKSNLDVPRQSGYSGMTATDMRKSDALTPCLAISVPGKTNIVTPWEGGS